MWLTPQTIGYSCKDLLKNNKIYTSIPIPFPYHRNIHQNSNKKPAEQVLQQVEVSQLSQFETEHTSEGEGVGIDEDVAATMEGKGEGMSSRD